MSWRGPRPVETKVKPWRLKAACLDPKVDPGLFHPEPGGDPWPAFEICDTCPVTRACAADRDGAPGVWGGELWVESGSIVGPSQKWKRPA